jgi:PEP-CTERM motif
MRKSLWIVLTVLLVAAGAPNLYADTYTPVFTCTGTCVYPVPTAPDVSFPSPTTIQETWNSHVFTLTLSALDSPTDTYVWTGGAVNIPFAASYGYDIVNLIDETSQVYASEFIIDPSIPFGTEIIDHGTLQFAVVATPEPSSVALMLAGIGFLLVLRKR